ncbi:MAG TPA: restriction endonuclease [Geothrix sp.]|nr:restriction endonuclease [Geothrix sp.]
MTIWAHADDQGLHQRFELYSPRHCHYCQQQMVHWESEDLWPHTHAFYRDLYYNDMLGGSYPAVAMMGLENELESWVIEDSPGEIVVEISLCPVCGWWAVWKQVDLFTPCQIWQMLFHAEGALRVLDLTDIELPITEARDYLSAKYESRFDIHPRKFEEVVASVFRSLGYDIHLSAYTHDGGIDIVLGGPGADHIGIQVKRYRHRIQVEQIRAFAGAMVLEGIPRGIFVTTSGFSKNTKAAAARYSAQTTRIDLVDGEAFLNALRVAQFADYQEAMESRYPFQAAEPPAIRYAASLHLNSL